MIDTQHLSLAKSSKAAPAIVHLLHLIWFRSKQSDRNPMSKCSAVGFEWVHDYEVLPNTLTSLSRWVKGFNAQILKLSMHLQ